MARHNAARVLVYFHLHFFFVLGSYFPDLPTARTQPIIMRKKMTWIDLLEYLRTWSALHTHREHHPEDVLHPDGPVKIRF